MKINYNEENINEIEQLLKNENEHNTQLKKTYTLIQKNSKSDVRISDESRKICAKILLK